MKKLLVSLVAVCATFLASTFWWTRADVADLSDIQIMEISDQTALFYMTDPAYPNSKGYETWVQNLQAVVAAASGGRPSALIWGGDNMALDRSFDWEVYSQIKNLRRAMQTISDQAFFVSGNHDLNRLRSVLFRGNYAIRDFDGHQSRVILTPSLALFLYDSYNTTAQGFIYDEPMVSPDQLAAYESAAEEICADRACLAIIGTQFADRPTLQQHWTMMASRGVQAVLTGDSHESRNRSIALADGAALPLLELSPSFGAKLPGEIDLSGRPSGIFRISAIQGFIDLEKIYLYGGSDHTLLTDGLCDAGAQTLDTGVSVDFLLDDLPCTPRPLATDSAALPTLPITISEPYDTFAFELNFDTVGGLHIASADLERGVILYALSKMDRSLPTHALTMILDNGRLGLVEYDRWMREQGRTDFDRADASACSLTMTQGPSNVVQFDGCGISHAVTLPFADGFLFGVKHAQDAPAIQTHIAP